MAITLASDVVALVTRRQSLDAFHLVFSEYQGAAMSLGGTLLQEVDGLAQVIEHFQVLTARNLFVHILYAVDQST